MICSAVFCAPSRSTSAWSGSPRWVRPADVTTALLILIVPRSSSTARARAPRGDGLSPRRAVWSTRVERSFGGVSGQPPQRLGFLAVAEAGLADRVSQHGDAPVIRRAVD